ncbi:MAG TPA: hypothetical protein PLM07_18980 [Candidatus Rifleibacterium sp.]|nr:hypothetical protein [Candidatus Rifleibacterium sp.]HPT47970.1 hypothetical protein [Candidatus Rifleibacterium sp.]
MEKLSEREAWAVCLLIRAVIQHQDHEEAGWVFTSADFMVGMDRAGVGLLWNVIKKLEPKVR